MKTIDVRNDLSVPLGDLAQVASWARAHIAVNPKPDFHIGPVDDQQLQRWWIVPRNPIANVYLHRFLRSDDDRAVHDHPWDNRSWMILDGEYLEYLQDGTTVTRYQGDVIADQSSVVVDSTALLAGGTGESSST